MRRCVFRGKLFESCKKKFSCRGIESQEIDSRPRDMSYESVDELCLDQSYVDEKIRKIYLCHQHKAGGSRRQMN